MFEAILGILAALISVWAKKRIKRLDDENAELRDTLAEIDLAVAVGDEDRVNARLADAVERLQIAEARRDPGRQKSRAPAGK